MLTSPVAPKSQNVANVIQKKKRQNRQKPILPISAEMQIQGTCRFLRQVRLPSLRRFRQA